MPTLRQMAHGLITKPRIEREAALAVDMILSLTLATFPGLFGKVACLAYFLLRDSRGGGMGKRLYNLAVVRATDGGIVSWQTALLRNILTLLPIFNLVDLYRFVANGKRLTDEWLGTEVRPMGKVAKTGDDDANK